ncbi:MAG: AsmA family protein [Caldimonas sp.]
MTSLWIRRIAIALGVLVAVLVVAVAVLVATFDANRYKSLAIDWMKNERQRTLAIDGPIELSLFPRLAVKVSKLRLSERNRADEFLAVDDAALAVRVLPLLKKELVVDRVSAKGVRAAWLRDAKGARNIDDLVSGSTPSASAGAVPPPGGAASVRFDVSGVRLDDVRLRLKDDLLDLAGTVVLESFVSGRLADQAETPVTVRANAQLTRPEPVRLALDGRLTIALDLDRKTAAAREVKLAIEGETAAVKALALALDGALAWDGKTLTAGPLQIAIKSASLGTRTLGASSLDVKRALYDSTGRRLELEALKLALAGKLGADPFEFALDWPQLVADAQRLTGSALTGRVKLAGATALAGTLKSGAPSGTFDALRLPGLELTLAGTSGPRKIDASLKADALVDAGKRAATLERLDARTTFVDPGLQPLQITVQGSAGGDAKAARWKLAGTINANRFETSGQAALGGEVPAVTASARFDSLDLNTLLQPDKAPGGSPTAPVPADTPVKLDGLKALDGRFDLGAGTLVFRRYRVADARLAATLERGTLRVSRLAGRAWGGSFEASGSAAAAGQRVALKLDASGVDVHALLKDVADKDLLEGTGQVSADVASTGTSIGALRSALSGTAALRLRDGAIKGVNLARTLRQAKAALSMKQDAVSRANTTEKTDFSSLTASARIAGGVASSDDLDMKSPFLRLGGAGRFDIGRGRIDYVAKATVIGSPAGQGSPELEALKGVTVPVALSGPFESIDWTIRWSDVAVDVLKGRLRDQLTETLGGKLGLPGASGAASSPGARTAPKDVLKDTLRGLFK